MRSDFFKPSMRARKSALVAVLLCASLSQVAVAAAQCRPDDVFCAELRIGPRRPAPVVVQPAPPPVIVVEPAPPPVVYQAPPPPIVVQQPRPIVVQRQVVVQPRTIQVMQPQRYQQVVEYEALFDIGVRLNAGMSFTPDVSMGGAGAAFRLRTGTHLAFDISTGVYGGSDYQGQNRIEVPLMVDALIFFNPENHFQFYAVLGGGASFAEINGTRTTSGTSRNYLGGEAGLGVELRMSRFFAINFDVRAFLRGRTGGGAPEFTQREGATVRSTDASAGVYGTLGLTFYFMGMQTYRH